MKPRSYELFIGGKWTSGSGDGVIDVIDPATEESIGHVPEGGVKEAERAIAAARDAFDYGPWPFMTPRERSASSRRGLPTCSKRERPTSKSSSSPRLVVCHGWQTWCKWAAPLSPCGTTPRPRCTKSAGPSRHLLRAALPS